MRPHSARPWGIRTVMAVVVLLCAAGLVAWLALGPDGSAAPSASPTSRPDGLSSAAAPTPAEQAPAQANSAPALGGPASRGAGDGSSVWLQAGQAPDATGIGSPGGAATAPPPAPVLSPEQRARADALSKLGYHIPERYYQMSLPALRQSAARGDAQALTHLAERYLFALDGQPQHPEYEPGFDYRQAARQALQQAYLGGNRHAAAMISESYLSERKPLEAAAWNLVARRAGDDLSADWFVRTQDYQQLSEAQRTEAARRAEALWALLHPTTSSPSGQG